MHAADVVEAHKSAPPDEGATVAGGDDNALVESLFVTTAGDTLAGREVIIGDVVVATRGDNVTLQEATDDIVPVESPFVATGGDTLAREEIVIGDVVAATRGDDKALYSLPPLLN